MSKKKNDSKSISMEEAIKRFKAYRAEQGHSDAEGIVGIRSKGMFDDNTVIIDFWDEHGDGAMTPVPVSVFFG